MQIKRHHVVAFSVLNLTFLSVMILKISRREPAQLAQYITSADATVCPSPGNLELYAAEPALAQSLGCERLPYGLRVLRVEDPSTETRSVWKVYIYRGSKDPARGWGRREQFLMPDGSAIPDATIAATSVNI